MLAKKKKAHILSPGDNYNIAAPPPTLCLQKPEYELFCFPLIKKKMPNKKAHIFTFGDNFNIAAPPPTPCLQETKYELFFFASIPYLKKSVSPDAEKVVSHRLVEFLVFISAFGRWPSQNSAY